MNARFPANLNPCIRLVATNGSRTLTSAWDFATPDCALGFDDLSLGSAKYAEFVALNCRDSLQRHANAILDSLQKRPFHMPLMILGGRTVRDEEVGHNTFGAFLVLDYKHLFNPTTRAERAFDSQARIRCSTFVVTDMLSRLIA